MAEEMCTIAIPINSVHRKLNCDYDTHVHYRYSLYTTGNRSCCSQYRQPQQFLPVTMKLSVSTWQKAHWRTLWLPGSWWKVVCQQLMQLMQLLLLLPLTASDAARCWSSKCIRHPSTCLKNDDTRLGITIIWDFRCFFSKQMHCLFRHAWLNSKI